MEEKRKNRQILSTAPKETPEQIAEEVSSEHYEYHLGDTVYIGASEYEILSFDDERVMLYDMEMPLFNKEFTRIEFDEKVRENPMNDHLKVPDQKTVPSEMLEQAKEIINEFCQHEYGSDADFSNLQEVGVAFTTVTDDEIPIQVNANLVDFSIDQYLDGKLIESTKYGSMEEMIESALVYLDFDDLTSITDEQLERVLESKTQREAAQVDDLPDLATRLTLFMKDYDYFGYQDNVEVNETDEEVIENTRDLLQSPDDVSSILDYL